MFVHSDEMQFDPAGRLHTFCHAVHGKWHMMGVSLSAGGSLQWFAEQVCQDAGGKGQKVYDVLNAEAAMPLEAALSAEAWIQAECMAHPDYREAYLAFVEKRPADFVKHWPGAKVRA